MTKTAINASGAESRQLYVDSIDEAMDRARREKRMHGETPRRPRRQLVDIGIRQLRAAEMLQRMLKAELDAKKKAGETPDTQWIFGFNALTTSITKTMEQVRRSRKTELDALGGLADGQLDDVLRVHLPRLAAGMSPSDRRLMLEAWFGADVADVLLKPREVTP